MNKLENLFFSVQTILHLSYNPDKTNSKVNPDLSPEDLEAQLMFCKNETAIMMTLYRALEGLVKKAETAELGSPTLGSDRQNLAVNIRKTKEAFFSRIHGLIGIMSQHLIPLTNTVDSLDPEKHNVVYGQAVDLKDSMENKVERLEIQIKKWERRVSRFVQKGAANSLSPLKKK